MKCSDVEKQLIFYAENSLDTTSGANITEHLEVCPDCQKKLAAIQAGLKFIDEEKKIEVNNFIYAKIKLKTEKNQKNNVRQLKKYFTPLMVAAALTFGVIIGNLVSQTAIEHNENISFAEGYFLNDFEQESIEFFLISEE